MGENSIEYVTDYNAIHVLKSSFAVGCHVANDGGVVQICGNLPLSDVG